MQIKISNANEFMGLLNFIRLQVQLFTNYDKLKSQLVERYLCLTRFQRKAPKSRIDIQSYLFCSFIV